MNVNLVTIIKIKFKIKIKNFVTNNKKGPSGTTSPKGKLKAFVLKHRHVVQPGRHSLHKNQ